MLFCLATFFQLFNAGIARIVQFCFVLESIILQRTILFWGLHLLEKSQHTQRSLPPASEKHSAPLQPERQNSSFLLLLFDRAASWVRKKAILPTSKIWRCFHCHRLGWVPFFASFEYSAVHSGRCWSYPQGKFEILVTHFCYGNFLKTSPVLIDDIFNRRKSFVPDTSTQKSPWEGCTLPLVGRLAAEDSQHCWTRSWCWSEAKLKLSWVEKSGVLRVILPWIHHCRLIHFDPVEIKERSKMVTVINFRKGRSSLRS